MKKIATYMFGLSMLAALTSCSDVMDEITSLVLDRNLAPVGLTAKVVNKTNVKLEWTVSDDLSNYVVEVFANDSLTFVGSPVSTLTVSASQVPDTIVGLEGETQYSFRVKTVTADDASRDSKWSTAYVQTAAEQILKSVAEADIKARAVTLRWPAGAKVAQIILTPTDGNLETVTYTVTDADVLAGSATVSGLMPEAEYKVVLKSAAGKTRGTQTFKTAIELADNDILVKEGQDIAEAVANAPTGYRLVVMPGTYTAGVEGTEGRGIINVSKDITIKGKSSDNKPVINARFVLSGGASLALEQVKVDGTGTSGDQTFVYSEAGTYGSLTIDNCEIANFVKGFFYITVAAQLDNIKIDNTLIHHIDCNGGDLFDSRKGTYRSFSLTNSTVYASCDGRDFIRFDDPKAFKDVKPEIVVDHCTLDGVSNNSTKRIFYVRVPNHSLTFTNNLVTNTQAIFANNKATAAPTFGGNNYFNAPNLVTDSGDALIPVDGGTAYDPQYANAGEGNFTVGSDDVKSAKVGDPRWIN